jgi:hypothetical protein
MSVNKAARKVNMCRQSASSYYIVYKNDPEKKTPLPRKQTSTMYTQEQIGNLIRSINDDKMTVTEASAKADMTYNSARQYYNKYLKDPNHNISIPQFHQCYMQDQKNEFIGYIINDKVSVKAASKKVKINYFIGYTYYHNYFKEQNPDIPTPSHIATRKCCTQDQISELIGYIVDDKMSIAAASRKANVCHTTTGRHYRQHLIDNNMEVPVEETRKRYTQDEVNELVGYIVDDKMTVVAASKKANISCATAYKYYRQHLNGQKRDGST